MDRRRTLAPQGVDQVTKLYRSFRPYDLKKRRKKLVNQAADLADLDSQARHRIRIKAKKLRYMVGFFKGVPEISSEPKAMKRLLRSLKKSGATWRDPREGS